MPHRPHVCSHANWHRHSRRGRRQTHGDLAGFIVELRSKLIYAPAADRHSQTGWTDSYARAHTHTGTNTHTHTFISDTFRSARVLKPGSSSCAARDPSKWQQLASSVQANWSHLHNTCLPSQFICGQFKQVCVTLSQPDVKLHPPPPPPTLINDPQSKAIAYHSCKDILHWAVCFLFFFKWNCGSRSPTHTDAHIVKTVPAIRPIMHAITPGAENKRAHLCDAGLQWPSRSPALLACCLGACFWQEAGR